MKKIGTLLGLCAALTANAGAHAATHVEIDPKIRRAIDTGLIGSFQRVAPQPGRAAVLVELARPADGAMLAILERAGVKLAYVSGAPLSYDRFVPAEVTASSLARLETLPDVARVSLVGPRGPLPLDQSAKLMRLADARGARPALDGLTGAGTLIADMDSNVDPFQPAFFKGDAGYYDWIDTDGDGVFTPGTDAVDLDRNGAADSSETAQPIIAATVDYFGKNIPERTSTFDPSTDFLFIDTNGNGARDFGAAAGFDDTAPALGEPLFVPDDVNRNGKLDVGERVVRLGTSKFKNIYVNLDYPTLATPVSHVYSRGVDLSQAKVDVSGGTLEGFPDAFHATGVNTILVGDLPLVGRRWVGIAPDADVDLVWDEDQSQAGMPVKGFTWALKDKPDVALFELATWTGFPLDGSDPLSALIDTAVTKDDVTATCPTGDQGSAGKHAHADVAISQQTSLPWSLPSKPKAGQGPLSYIDLSIDIRGGVPTTLTLTGPTGESADISTTVQGTFSTGDSYYATKEQTQRGTAFYDVILYVDKSQPPLPVGTWKVNVGGSTSSALTVDAYVSDDKSSWAVGAAWDPSVASESSTIGVPSTADHCIAVNAAPDHVGGASSPWYDLSFYVEYNVSSGYEETQGQIRAYSPRGPRIDGVTKPDITAPDNPWVANEYLPSLHYPYGSYSVFGGTSGASPHVTGTAALLAQAGIHGDAARDAIRAGAIVDSDTGAVPNADYGYGRLDAAGAFGVKTAGVDPSVTITVSPSSPGVGDVVQLTPVAKSNDGNDGALEAKWDDQYDGTWDTEYGGISAHAFTPTADGKYPFKVRVRNASGHVAEAVVWVAVATTTSVDAGCSCHVAPSQTSFGFAAFVLGVAIALRRRSR